MFFNENNLQFKHHKITASDSNLAMFTAILVQEQTIDLSRVHMFIAEHVTHH